MKIDENTNLLDKVQVHTGKTEHVKDKKKTRKQKDTIQASTLNLADDKIAKKRKQARAMVMSLLEDAFSGDKKIDEDIAERLKHIDSLAKENEEYSSTLNDIKEQKESLKEYYGVTDDSREQQDLELLRKEKNAPFATIDMSEEEKQRLEQIHADGLTDYQKQVLELDAAEKEYKSKIAENQKTIIEENAVVRGIGIERLKAHEMVDAQKQGDQIMTAANKEIIGTLYEEVKDHQDEKLEEQKKAAEEKKQEEEELEKRLEAAKADKEKYTKDNNDMDKMYQLGNSLDSVRNKAAGSTLEDVKKSLNQIVGELKLTSEDLKGLVVDENE